MMGRTFLSVEFCYSTPLIALYSKNFHSIRTTRLLCTRPRPVNMRISETPLNAAARIGLIWTNGQDPMFVGEFNTPDSREVGTTVWRISDISLKSEDSLNRFYK